MKPDERALIAQADAVIARTDAAIAQLDELVYALIAALIEQGAPKRG